MLVGVYFAKPLVASLLGGVLNVGALVTLIVIGMMIYGGISYFTQRELTTEVLGLLVKGFSLNKKRRQRRSALVSAEATEN